MHQNSIHHTQIQNTLHNKQARTHHIASIKLYICANAHILPIRHFMSSNISFTSVFFSHTQTHIVAPYTRISFNPVPGFIHFADEKIQKAHFFLKKSS